MLEPPRQNVKIAPATARRGARPNAPIEIIEFSDFQCPYCQRVGPTVKQVLDTYGDRIHFVYRHYPLPNHPNARPAAEAVAVRNEQGKFWPYHDRLFANQRRLGGTRPQAVRRRSRPRRRQLQRLRRLAQVHRRRSTPTCRPANEAGVNGTPAFFINGRLLSGAQPFEAFKIIDDELALKKR